MAAEPGSDLAHVVRRAFIIATVLAAVLAATGLLVFPAASKDLTSTLPTLAGVFIVLSTDALLGLWGSARLARIDLKLLRIAVAFGLLAAATYAAEIVLEYVLLPRDNTLYGYAEFGLVFLLYLTAGFIVGLRTRKPRDGLMVAVGAALISTLLWYIVVLAVTYAMKGTPQQAVVFQAEGNRDDFAHSGSTNFEAWLMQDLLGAGFYHLLLGPIVAAIFGTTGGWLGRFLAFQPQRSAGG